MVLLIVGLGTTAAGAATTATATAETVPAANQTLAGPPARIEVTPPDGASSGAARVLDSAGKEVAGGRLVPAGDGALAVWLPRLGTGPYLVVWSAGADRGAFGFDVTGQPASPAVVTQPKPTTTLGPLQDNLVQWAPLALIMIFVGTLGLRLLVATPAARQIHSDRSLATSERRLTQVAAAAITLFVPTTVMSVAFDDGRWDFSSIWPSLGADWAGHVTGGRLAVTALAAIFVIPLALRRSRPSVPLTVAGLASGMAELVGREVPGSANHDWPRTVVNTALYSFHLFGAAFWIGGLVALLALLLLRGIPEEARQEFWPVATRRFSTCATCSVGVLVLTGLWLYWVHIDGLHQLLSTLYGRTLFVKLTVVAVLVLVGASNQFWLMPLIDGHRAARDPGAVTRAVMRHFRTTIAVEVALGLGVLFIAALLAGSARNQAFQASPRALAQTAVSGATTLELYPSGLQPGLIDYNVELTGGPSPEQVTLDFASSQLGVPAQQVTAAAIGDRTYRVVGYYTPVVGTWQVTVHAGRLATATFPLPITATPPTPGKAPPPRVRWTTWLAGAAETLFVGLVLLTCFRISRRLAQGHATRDGSGAEPTTGALRPTLPL